MKQNKTVKSAGPFYVESHSQGEGMVYLRVFPAFPKYNYTDLNWAENRYNGKGGGPGIFTAISTAKELSSFLNSIYTPEIVENWDKRIKSILDKSLKSFTFAQCSKCCTLSSVPNEWIYCPVCGKKYKKDENCNNT